MNQELLNLFELFFFDVIIPTVALIGFLRKKFSVLQTEVGSLYSNLRNTSSIGHCSVFLKNSTYNSRCERVLSKPASSTRFPLKIVR